MVKLAVLSIATILLVQTAPAQTPIAALVGKWVTTAVPPPGEAPMGPPTFSLEIKGDKVVVTFEKQDAADAVVFCPRGRTAAQDVSIILIRQSRGVTNRMTMIRPIAVGQVRVENYFEFTDGRATPSFYYDEVFKKAK